MGFAFGTQPPLGLICSPVTHRWWPFGRMRSAPGARCII